MGFANENSNMYTWMRYLNPTQGRLFVQPLLVSTKPLYSSSNWRNYVANVGVSSRQSVHGSQFGLSFTGAAVESQDAWLAAVAEVRAVSKAPGDPEFLDWLPSHTAVGWDLIFMYLNTTLNSASMAQIGNPMYVLNSLRTQRYNVLAVWDVRCRNLAYTTTDPADPEYWKERWETYRLFYLGGRWLARTGATAVELYNEPDKDLDCIDGARWVDDVRIRAQAMRDAYADYNSLTGDSLAPNLMAPTTANPWSDAFS